MKKSIITISLFSLLINSYPLNIQKCISYHELITHFYYIKCLTASTYFLSRLHKQNYRYKPCNIIVHKDYIQIDATLFFHHKMRTCLHEVLRIHSLQPILLLLQEIKSYHYLQDSLLIHEFFLLIFTVHKQILFHECEESPHSLKKSTFETILEISEKINRLPIAEILNAIDMLINELPPFLEKYEFNSKISWKDWLKKYWWVPPIFGGWFALKILLRLQRPQFYYSPYFSQTPAITLPPIITNDPALLEIRHDQSLN
jgi:hypothetical protein